MSRFFFLTRINACLIMACLLLGACTPLVSYHGNQVLEKNLEQVIEGTSSRDDVAKLLGSPSVIAMDRGKFWIYLSYKRKTLYFLEPWEEDRDMTVIHFDQKGVVSKIEKYGQGDGESITFASAETPPTISGSQNWIERVISNIGQVVPGGLPSE